MKRIKQRISYKISLLFLGVMALLIIGSGSISYMEFGKIFEKQIINDLDNIMIQSSININNLLNNVTQATLFMSADNTIPTILTKKSLNSVQSIYSVTLANEQFVNYINIPLSSTLSSYSATFFINDKLPINHYISNSQLQTDGTFANGIFNNSSVSSEPWYINTVKAKGNIYTFALTDKHRLFISRLVNNPHISHSLSNDTEMGVIVISLDIRQIGNQIQATNMTESTQVMLIDKNNNIIYSNNDQFLGLDASKHPLLAKNDYLKSTQNIISDYPIAWDLHLLTIIPHNDITKRTNGLIKIIFTTTLVLLSMGILLVLFLSKYISSPIKKLAVIMENVNLETQLDIHLIPPSEDEVGSVYKSFNNLMSRINDLMNAVYISKIKEKDSELKALESQINPHFLYNTLDLVSWLALLDGNERIATLVSSLSDMMRYNIKNNNKLVTIAQEIEHIKNYMNILFIRHNDKFDINIDIPAQLTSVKIPKLILQPLVENSILHGFQTMSKKGYISIKGNIENSNIIITVEDNGIGANPDSLNAFLFGDNDSNIHTDSYGIKNVHERIRLNFGEAYGLSYKKNDSTGITAIITLPNAQ